MTKLRSATAADIPVCVALGRIMHAESQFSHFEFSGLKVAASMAALIKSQCVIVAEKDGVVIGGIAGYEGQAWYGVQPIATELATFIHPDHRGGFLVARLVKAFIQWAKDRGIKDVHIGMVSGINQETTENLYVRLGGKSLGTLFKFGG